MGPNFPELATVCGKNISRGNFPSEKTDCLSKLFQWNNFPWVKLEHLPWYVSKFVPAVNPSHKGSKNWFLFNVCVVQVGSIRTTAFQHCIQHKANWVNLSIAALQFIVEKQMLKTDWEQLLTSLKIKIFNKSASFLPQHYQNFHFAKTTHRKSQCLSRKYFPNLIKTYSIYVQVPQFFLVLTDEDDFTIISRINAS